MYLKKTGLYEEDEKSNKKSGCKSYENGGRKADGYSVWKLKECLKHVKLLKKVGKDVDGEDV